MEPRRSNPGGEIIVRATAVYAGALANQAIMDAPGKGRGRTQSTAMVMCQRAQKGPVHEAKCYHGPMPEFNNGANRKEK